MKRIILCADDYGQNKAISQAIIELISENRLSATSCMTTSPDWLDQAKHLQPFDNIDIGLHFNLTEGRPLSQEMAVQGFSTLQQILLKSHLKQINKAAVTAELHAQLDQFVKGMGRLPDYIDGHQHIHHMPVIRDAVLAVYQQRLSAQSAQKTYIRCVNDVQTYFRFGDAYVKRVLIQSTGASSFKKQLLANKIPHNSSFSGIYTFSLSKQYGLLFKQFLDNTSNNGMIMCHPGLQDTTSNDEIKLSRYDEYCYFKSHQFLEECLKNKVIIARFQ